MKSIGDYIDTYRILWLRRSSILYECYIVERATDPGISYVLQKWRMVRFASDQGYLRFLSQMGRLKALCQPLILPIEDFGIDTDDHPYVLLPYEMAQMERLSERLQHGTLSEDEAENMLTAVSTALVLAHQHDLIHGFFSPESVLLTPRNEVRVTAFLGSNPDLGDARSSLPTQYRFPESSASRLSDQYALAGLVQNLLLEQGELPEDAASIRQTIARAQASVPAQRFESIREFLGQVGYLLDPPENEKELETPLSYSASQPGGTPLAQWPYVTWSHLATHKRALGIAVLAVLLIVLGGTVLGVDYSQQQATFSAQTTATAAVQATAESQTVVAYEATRTAEDQATATVVARAFPFTTNLAFRDNLTQSNDNWIDSGCGFTGNSYLVSAEAGYIEGCPRQGTETVMETTMPYAFQIVFENIQAGGNGAIGIMYSDMNSALTDQQMFVINKYGYYFFCGGGGGIGYCGPLDKKVSFPVTFPLSIGMVAKSHGCSFYVNGNEVATSGDDSPCNGALGAAAYGFGESVSADFVEADFWSLATP